MDRWIELGRDAIRQARRERQLSQQEAARGVPTSYATWRRWESEGRVPAGVAEAVARVLGIEIPRDGESEEQDFVAATRQRLVRTAELLSAQDDAVHVVLDRLKAMMDNEVIAGDGDDFYVREDLLDEALAAVDSYDRVARDVEEASAEVRAALLSEASEELGPDRRRSLRQLLKVVEDLNARFEPIRRVLAEVDQNRQALDATKPAGGAAPSDETQRRRAAVSRSRAEVEKTASQADAPVPLEPKPHAPAAQPRRRRAGGERR